MNTRQADRIFKKMNANLDKLVNPINNKIKELEINPETGRILIPFEIENQIIKSNAIHNAELTKFNKKYKKNKIDYNRVRETVSEEIITHEFNQYVELVCTKGYEKYNMLVHDINNKIDHVSKCYKSGISVDDCVIYIKKKK